MSQGTVYVPANYTLTFTANAGSNGTYYGPDSVIYTLLANASITLGPFSSDVNYMFNSTTGKMTATVTAVPPPSLGGGIVRVGLPGTSIVAAVDTIYIVQNSSFTTVKLPPVAAIGTIVGVQGLGAAGFIIAANIGQTIQFGSMTSSSGGGWTSTNKWDSIQVICVVDHTTWSVFNDVGSGFTKS